MALHGGNESRIMRLFALDFIVQRQLLPQPKNSTLISQSWEQDLKSSQLRVDFVHGKSQAIVIRRTSGHSPILVKNLRNRPKLMLLIT